MIGIVSGQGPRGVVKKTFPFSKINDFIDSAPLTNTDINRPRTPRLGDMEDDHKTLGNELKEMAADFFSRHPFRKPNVWSCLD